MTGAFSSCRLRTLFRMRLSSKAHIFIKKALINLKKLFWSPVYIFCITELLFTGFLPLGFLLSWEWGQGDECCDPLKNSLFCTRQKRGTALTIQKCKTISSKENEKLLIRSPTQWDFTSDTDNTILLSFFLICVCERSFLDLSRRLSSKNCDFIISFKPGQARFPYTMLITF